MKNNNENNNEKILFIGFTMIILVAAITIFKATKNDGQNNDIATYHNLQTKKEDKSKNNIESYKTISAKDLQKKISLGERITLIDVRPFDEYIAEHILDTINIPLDEFPVKDKIKDNQPIFIIGKNSSDDNIKNAIEKIKEENKNLDLTILAGGMESWDNLVGITVSYGNPESFIDQSKVSYTDTDKVKQALEQNIPMFILDVRTKEEFEEGHIAGSKNIPMDELEKRRNELLTIPKIVVVGVNDLQEFQASVQLYDMNLTSAFVMKGSIQKWKESGYEIIK